MPRTISALCLVLLLSACVSGGQRHDSPAYGYPAAPYGSPPGYAVYPVGPIAVASARYASSRHSCDATRLIASQASGRHHYSVQVTNNLCGDPHPEKAKTLHVTYYCGGPVKTASAGEHHTLTLSCP